MQEIDYKKLTKAVIDEIEKRDKSEEKFNILERIRLSKGTTTIRLKNELIDEIKNNITNETTVPAFITTAVIDKILREKTKK